MNQILRRKLDPSDVASELDHMTREIQMLQITVDPVANAPAKDQNLLAEAQHNQRQCYSFSNDWNADVQAKLSDALRSAGEERKRWETSRPSVASAVTKAEEVINKEYSAKYKATLAPRLIAWRDQIPPSSLKQALLSDLTSIDSFFVVGSRCRTLKLLTTRSGKNIPNADSLYDECEAFTRAWQHAPMERRNDFLPRPPAGANVVDANSIAFEIAKTRVQSYESTLAPSFVAWQKQVFSREPTLDNNKNYGMIRSMVDLQTVCADMTNLTSAYRDKITVDVRKNVVP